MKEDHWSELKIKNSDKKNIMNKEKKLRIADSLLRIEETAFLVIYIFELLFYRFNFRL